MTRLAELLQSIVDLLVRVGEHSVALGLQEMADEARSAADAEDRRAIVMKVISMYGGMGSFNDFVIQNSRGFRPGNDELATLRHALFEEAVRNLGPDAPR